MTNDFDDLISAYLDGQATPEEVALVEGDPALRAETEAMASVVNQLETEQPVPPVGLRQRQIANAMAAFDGLAIGDAEATATRAPDSPVISDLAAHRADRAFRSRSQSQRGLPAWLGAAAAIVVAIAGLGWVISNSGRSDSSFDATASFSEENTTEGAAGDDSASAEALVAADAVEESLAESEAGTDMAADETADSAAPVPGADQGEGTDGDQTSTTAATAQGFFPEEAAKTRDANRLALAAPPTDAELEDITFGPLLDAALSLCSSQIEAEPGQSLIGMVPISVGVRQGEVLVYETDGGSERSAVVLSSDLGNGEPLCGPLE